VEDEQNERWKTLCEQAAMEKNPEQLMKLVDEINRLLEQRDRQKSTEDAA